VQPSKIGENYDTLLKICPIINLTKDIYLDGFECSKEASSDESILHFRGQYMPAKPSDK
jgi:hypothetical protein